MTPTNSKILALTIDLVNKAVLDYLFRKDDHKPTPHYIHDKVYKQNDKITLDIFDSAINIMGELGYVKIDTSEDTGEHTIDYLYATNKGILLDLNGGMISQVQTEKRKENLYKWGQIAVVVGGLYYLIELVKSIFPMIKYLWKLITC